MLAPSVEFAGTSQMPGIDIRTTGISPMLKPTGFSQHGLADSQVQMNGGEKDCDCHCDCDCTNCPTFGDCECDCNTDCEPE